MTKWNRSSAFAHYGAVCKNPRWSWSARSPDGKTVVMTMWKDEITREEGRCVYQSRPRYEGKTRNGAVERMENLKWAQDNCDGLVRVVIAVAEDTKADPRKAIDWYPQNNLIMKITHLDEDTGAFRAESLQ